MLYYLYAVADRLPDAWCPPPAGVGGGPVIAHHVGGLVLLASRVEVVPAAGPKMLALHHDVVSSAMDADALVPFRFGVTLPVCELQPWFRMQAGVLRASLASVRGCVEMSVKLLRLESMAGVGRGRSAPASRSADGGCGPAHLRALGQRLIDRAEIGTWMYRPSESPGNVAASVAFLVPRQDVPAFLTRIAPVASHASGIAVVPTGPWPAYSFGPVFERPPLARTSRPRLAYTMESHAV
jgi:hypothetical protein